MRINWNIKYNTIATYSIIVGSSIIIFYLALSQLGVFFDKVSGIISILNPFIFGFAIAYLFNFILKFYEERVFVAKYSFRYNLKSKRVLSLCFTYATGSLILYLFIMFVLPQLVNSILGLVENIPVYISNISSLLKDFMMDFDINEEYYNLLMENINEFVNYIIKMASNMLPILGGLLAKIASSIWNIVLGIIISIYLLKDKEKFFGLCKKITFAIFSEEKAKRIIELNHRSNFTFGRFLSGKIIDSTIICILTFIILSIFKMPYTLLISVIVGVTNIIPFFGPFIGAIPSFIIILFVSPIKALWFLLIIFIIQQLDGNVIGPKILGDSIGISAFWILFSILVAGKFLGLVGMVIGVPLFAVIYSIIKEVVENRLSKKGLKTKTTDYM